MEAEKSLSRFIPLTEDDAVLTIEAWRMTAYFEQKCKESVLGWQQPGRHTLKTELDEAHVYFYQNDPNGMPIRLQDSEGEGEVVWEAQFTPFGQLSVTGTSQLRQPLRMQGQYYDTESGLHYNRYRYYDPACGVFISQDPIGLKGGLNPYQFAVNTLGWVDPLGLNGWNIDGVRTTSILQGGPFNEKYYKDSKTGLWWSKDTHGHGGSAFKVYEETSTSLEWIADADQNGDYLNSFSK